MATRVEPKIAVGETLPSFVKDISQRRIDVFPGQDAFAAQALERPLQFVGKRLEHTSDSNSDQCGNKHDKCGSKGCQAAFFA